jgi:hypothetical protein
MGEISVGPADTASANDGHKVVAPPMEVDAQDANAADTQHGLAGTESKPWSETPKPEGSDHRPGDSESPPDEPNDMVSDRRHAERDNTCDAPPERE